MTPNPTPMPGTALPWRTTDDFTCAMIGTKEADICEMQDWPLEFIPEQQANAAYIVWACNNAPALLRALENAKWLLEGIKRAGWVTNPSFGDDINLGLERIDAAIAGAKP